MRAADRSSGAGGAEAEAGAGSGAAGRRRGTQGNCPSEGGGWTAEDGRMGCVSAEVTSREDNAGTADRTGRLATATWALFSSKKKNLQNFFRFSVTSNL